MQTVHRKLCKYAILRYVPDEYREEFINIGLTMHNLTDCSIKTKLTTNYSRVKSFDDEIDLEFLKVILEGIEEQFSISTVSGPSLKILSNDDFLEESTRYYVNQLQFNEIRNIYSEDVDKDFDDLFKTYVYFEHKKKHRITNEEVKRLMKRVFQNKGFEKKLDRNPVLYTNNNEEITLDYGIFEKDKNYYLKAFSLDYDKKKTAATNAKTWVYNIERLMKTSNSEFKFVLNNTDLKDKKTKLIFDILSEVSEPIFLDQLDDFVDKLSTLHGVNNSSN